MKRAVYITLLLITAVLLATSLVATSAGPALVRVVLGGGGGTAQSGALTLSGTLEQAVTGRATNG